jgi:tetratricopeptide (TPR) repeat protein
MPVLLLLLDYWPLRRTLSSGVWRRLILEKIPLFALSAGLSVVTTLAQRVTMPSLEQLPFLPRLKNAAVSVIIYIKQMIWPSDLAVFYPHPHNQLNNWVALSCTALICGASLVAILVRRRAPYIFLGWFWYLVLLFPVLGVFQAGLQARADRFVYLPHIGISILLTWTIADLTSAWRNQRLVLTTTAATIIASLMFCAWWQTLYWRDSISLWTHTLAVTSMNQTAHRDLAAALWARGRKEEATVHTRAAEIIHWQTVLKDYPFDVSAHDNLGVLLVQSGDVTGALREWETSLDIDSNDGNAENNLAWVFATYPDKTIRDGRRAVELAEKAVNLPGGNAPMILRTLAAAYAEQGEFPKAIETAQRALELATMQNEPSLAETMRNEIELYRARSPYREMPTR